MERRLALVAAFACALAWRPARGDGWTGTDKALHFAFSAVIAGLGYAAGVACCDRRPLALAVGGGVGLAAGGGKELLDMAGLGQPSVKDLVWDVAGVLVGIGLALSMDIAARGPSEHWRAPAPALSPPRATGRGPP